MAKTHRPFNGFYFLGKLLMIVIITIYIYMYTYIYIWLYIASLYQPRRSPALWRRFADVESQLGPWAMRYWSPSSAPTLQRAVLMPCDSLWGPQPKNIQLSQTIGSSRSQYIYIYLYMSCEPYLLHNAIDGVFLPRSPVPQRFCLLRSRGVPTSFYKLNMMFLTNRGTPEYYFPYTQIRAVAHIYIYKIYIYIDRSLCLAVGKWFMTFKCSLAFPH